MLSRRIFLASVTGAALTAAAPTRGAGQATPLFLTPVDMRGSIDATDHGIMPDALDNQSKRFAAILKKAAAANVPVFLPPGAYRISNIVLPDNTRITGVAGASRIVYSGDGFLFRSDSARRVELTNITVDGGNRWLGDDVAGLIDIRGASEVLVDNCEISGSRKHAIQLERCGGRIERSHITGAADAAVYAVESKGLSITGNRISDCGNGGILVHRWTKAEDGTMISGNRVERILANDGGTGQNGNGINLFRADNAIISGNHLSDCAFSAIRANAASDVQITGNQCLRSGETAIYSEFGFEGAVVGNNLIDGAANGVLIVNFDVGGRLASVTNNVIRNLRLTGPYMHDGAGFGFGIAVEADTVVSGNVIENAPKWGMMLGWGPYLRDLIVTGNIVRQSPVGCAVSVADGAGKAIISDNLFSQTPEGGVIGYAWNKKMTDELALAGGDRFSNLTIERNRT